MASSSLLLLSLFLISSLPLKVLSFSIDLHHRDSIKSPHYDPSNSLSDRLHTAARRSHLRARFLTRSFSPSKDSFNFDLIPSSGEYFMTVNIGTPPRKIFAIADTGSDLIWTNCNPCDKCYKQKDPLFDPKNSTTYINLSCDTVQCSSLPVLSCAPRTNCTYIYSYGDSSTTAGNLANETFSFVTTNGNTVHIPDISFGCSHESRGNFPEVDDGIVGLGAGPLSLVSQLGPTIDNKFSYCLLPFEKTNPSQLRFGADAVVGGGNAVTVPYRQVVSMSYYAVKLTGISVGEEKVNVKGVNMIVDSGTTVTILEQRIVGPLSDAVARAVDLPRLDDPEGVFSLCFNASGREKDLNLPTMTIQFGEVAVKLDPLNVFVFVKSEVVCMAIVAGMAIEDGGDYISILGNIAQSNFHVGYDTKEKTITFAQTDCSKL